MHVERANDGTASGRRSGPSSGGGLCGAELARHVRINEAPSLSSKSISNTEISVTECACSTVNHGMTDKMPYRDAYLAVINLMPTDKDLWNDGRPIRSGPLGAGMLVFHDLRQNPSANFKTQFHTLNFCLPRTALHDIAAQAHARRIEALNFTPGHGYHDDAAHGLGMALLPAFKQPEQASRLFVDSVTTAFAIHIAQIYGGMRGASRSATGNLAPWQERRAKEIMSADLAGAMPIALLAAECRLSVAHFTRCFRQSTGLAPHQWLLRRRVEVAKDILSQGVHPQGRLSLADVGLACGFADQSHFTRVFTRLVGVSPGIWRREVPMHWLEEGRAAVVSSGSLQ
jgi:AraC family transcriptional regulator